MQECEGTVMTVPTNRGPHNVPHPPSKMLSAMQHSGTHPHTHRHAHLRRPTVPLKPTNRPHAVAPRHMLVRCDGGSPAALRPQVTRRMGLAMGTACVSLQLLQPGTQSASPR